MKIYINHKRSSRDAPSCGHHIYYIYIYIYIGSNLPKHPPRTRGNTHIDAAAERNLCHHRNARPNYSKPLGVARTSSNYPATPPTLSQASRSRDMLSTFIFFQAPSHHRKQAHRQQQYKNSNNNTAEDRPHTGGIISTPNQTPA